MLQTEQAVLRFITRNSMQPERTVEGRINKQGLSDNRRSVVKWEPSAFPHPRCRVFCRAAALKGQDHLGQLRDKSRLPRTFARNRNTDAPSAHLGRIPVAQNAGTTDLFRRGSLGLQVVHAIRGEGNGGPSVS